MTTILGVSCLYHDAAAAVVRDGEILAAAQEERFTLRKHDRRYPEAAIAYCLDTAGGREALDAVVFYEDPVLSLDRIVKNAIELAPDTGKTWPAAARSQLGQTLNVAERLRQLLPPRAGDNVFLSITTCRTPPRRFTPRRFARRPSSSPTVSANGPRRRSPPATTAASRRCGKSTTRIRSVSCTAPSPTIAGSRSIPASTS